MRPNNLENKTLRKILKSSASMYESSGRQFLRTTTGILSGPNTFYESRFAKNLLTIWGVTKILSSFKLVLERKIGKGFFRTVFSK